MTGLLFPDALIFAIVRRSHIGIFAMLLSLSLLVLGPLFAYQVWKRNHHVASALTREPTRHSIGATSAS